MNRRRHPTRLLATITAVSMLAALAGCSGSSLDNGSATGDTIRIGLMLPQSGPYKAIGDDLAKGRQLYLDTHGGKLGGHPVQVITADEAEGKQSALNAARKLLDKDKVAVIAGTGSADAVESIKTLVTEKKIPFVGTGGRPVDADRDIGLRLAHLVAVARARGGAESPGTCVLGSRAGLRDRPGL